MCGGLNEDDPYCLLCLNVQSPASGTVWEGPGGVT